MIPNDSSSHLPTTNSRAPKTLSLLLSDPKKLQEIALVLRSHGWELVEEFLQAERQTHLERAVESDDLDKRQQAVHIARWLKGFLEIVIPNVHDRDQEQRHPTVDPQSMNPDSMPLDSDGLAERQKSNGGIDGN